MKKIKIGKITGATGLKGEVKVYSYSENNSLFDVLSSVYIDCRLTPINRVRYKGKTPIVTFEGVTDRNKAEAIIGRELFIEEKDLPKLPAGVFYVRDIIGFEVLWNDTKIGTLKDVRTDTPQDLYIVNTGEGEVLIPGVKEFIIEIDTAHNVINVNLPEGLLEL